MTAILQTSHGNSQINQERRAAVITACVIGGVGSVGVAVPFITSMNPSERAKAAGAPVEVDVTSIPPGGMNVVGWRGKPVWILHRTQAMISLLEHENVDLLNDPYSQRSAYPTPAWALRDPPLRSIRPQFFVAIGICTHLGCSPNGPFGPNQNPQLGPYSGFVCPCHGSTYDLAGRVFKNKPASDNLQIPPYRYMSSSEVIIGESP